MGLKDKLDELRQQGLRAVKESSDLDKINDIRVRMLGKKRSDYRSFTRNARVKC